MIHPFYVDSREPRANGQNCPEDQTLPNGPDGRGMGTDPALLAEGGPAWPQAAHGFTRSPECAALPCALGRRLADAAT